MLREIKRGTRKSRVVQAVEAGERAAARMLKTGRTPGGHRLWTEREDAIVCDLYPDYKALCRRLKRRTLAAIRSRAHYLGIQRRVHKWTGFEVARLRKLYPAGTRAELMTIVPTVTWIATSCRARAAGARRLKRYKPTGFPVLDAIRQRCLELNYSMVDLDAIAKTGGYFTQARWIASGVANVQKLARAAKALDGVMTIVWRKRA
jgi:hypothetical protein